MKKEDTKKEDYLKVVERLKREEMTTREWQEFKPRTVRAVKAFGEGREDMLSYQLELSFEPGALITGVRPASWLADSQFYHSRWLEGTLDGRVGLVLECCVKYLPDQSD